jgi:hypothetical protein
MKQIKVLIAALQDIITETFSDNVDRLTAIREIAQKAMHKYEENIPRPDIDCPNRFEIGKDYYRFGECSLCPRKYAQICAVYNYVWHQQSEEA